LTLSENNYLFNVILKSYLKGATVIKFTEESYGIIILKFVFSNITKLKPKPTNIIETKIFIKTKTSKPVLVLVHA
jgi:hypothetical protein